MSIRLSVFLSVRPHGATRLPLDGLSRKFIFPKMCWENSSFVKFIQEWQVLYMKTSSHLWQYIAEPFLEWEISQMKVVDKIKTHISYSVTFSRILHRLWDNVENYGGDRKAANGNMADVICWIMKAKRAQVHASARVSKFTFTPRHA
jgi:hypothetical protein